MNDEIIRFWVIHGFLKRSQGKHYEYWYEQMSNTERRWLCTYYNCNKQPCMRHNP
jgi:hypothetical protein